MHSHRKQTVVLVVHGHDDEQLRSTGRVIVHLTEGESIVLKVVRVASRGGVTHMREFAVFLVNAQVKQFCRDCCIEHKIAVEEPAYQRGREVDEPT